MRKDAKQTSKVSPKKAAVKDLVVKDATAVKGGLITVRKAGKGQQE